MRARCTDRTVAGTYRPQSLFHPITWSPAALDLWRCLSSRICGRICPTFGQRPVHRTKPDWTTFSSRREIAMMLLARCLLWLLRMNGHHLATLLVSSLDRLITQVADDPCLSSSLQRERARLLLCIEQHLGSPPKVVRAKTAMHSQRRLSLRVRCYQALAAGFLPSQRFDVLLLLAHRAKRRRNYSGSSSEALRSSSPGSSPGRVVEDGGKSGLGSALRMCLSSTSTICA